MTRHGFPHCVAHNAGPITRTALQRAFRRALQQSGVRKAAHVHSLRHSMATHLLEAGDAILKHKSARKCLETACRKLKFPVFYHHAFRHFYATCCIESGVDIPTVSRWLGHKDGGPLAMKVYSHLRPAHSDPMIAQVSFDEQAPAKVVPMQAA